MATDYTTLITNQHAAAPRFVATVALLAGSIGAVADVAASLRTEFDVDTAIGAQLDAVGKWVGISRHQVLPITGAFFSWNTPGLGWNQANWKGVDDPDEGITSLDDETYRAVIKAKIGSNYWSGTADDLRLIGQTALLSVGVQAFILDNMDMSTTVYVLGGPTAVMVQMIQRGVTPPKTAGVRITGYILASTPGAPFFALSVPTTTEVGGLDFGSFGTPT